MWCNDPDRYAGGGVATGRATLAGQVKGEHPDKVRYTGPPGWGLGRWANTPSLGKKHTHMLKNLDKSSEKKPRHSSSWLKLIYCGVLLVAVKSDVSAHQ